MKVKILGGGCVKCNKLEQLTKEILNNMKINYEIEHIKDILEYAKYGVVFTPALIINDKLIVSGKVPDREELAQLINSL